MLVSQSTSSLSLSQKHPKKWKAYTPKEIYTNALTVGNDCFFGVDGMVCLMFMCCYDSMINFSVDEPKYRKTSWCFNPSPTMFVLRQFAKLHNCRNFGPSAISLHVYIYIYFIYIYIHSLCIPGPLRTSCFCQRARNRGSVFAFFYWGSFWKCYAIDCLGTYFRHVQTCNVTRVQSATQSTASVHTLHMSKPVM